MQSVVVCCSAAQPRLGSVQQLPTLGSRVCEYLLLSFSLPLPPPSELSFSTLLRPTARLQHPSLFHSRVPASRPRPNPCARVMIRDCVSQGGKGAKSAFVCGSLFLFRSVFLSLILVSFILFFRRDSVETPAESDGTVVSVTGVTVVDVEAPGSSDAYRFVSAPGLRLRLTCTYKGGFIHKKKGLLSLFIQRIPDSFSDYVELFKLTKARRCSQTKCRRMS